VSECREHEPLRRQGSPCPYCRIAELEAETDNLKAIMLGEGGTKKVDLKQRYKGEAK